MEFRAGRNLRDHLVQPHLVQLAILGHGHGEEPRLRTRPPSPLLGQQLLFRPVTFLVPSSLSQVWTLVPGFQWS